MKVLLIANYRPDGQESMQRFSALLERGLSEAGHEVRVCRPAPIVGGASKLLGYVDKLALFPLTLGPALDWADVIHICDHSNAMFVPRLRGRRHVVTCHDTLAIRSAAGDAPEHRTAWLGRQLQRMILAGLRRAQHVVCVSQATHREFVHRSGNSSATVIHNGLDYRWSPMPANDAAARISSLGIPAERFLLHVGGNQWYKNRLGVLRIFASVRRRANLRLVMAGKPWTREMRNFVNRQGLSEDTIELTSVSDEDLRALYSAAALLLFPSLYEGFGWPIIEAQACGCPIVTSNRAPMDEIGGDGAAYADPEDAEAAAEIVLDALVRSAALRDAGFRNAKRFATDEMISAYSNLYREL